MRDQKTPVFRVATINFACPNSSPFEYHDGSLEMVRLNSIFKKHLERLPEFSKDKFSWDVGKIDVLIKKPRYCVLYSKDVCIIEGRLVTKQQFNIIWDYEFNKNRSILGDSIPNASMINLTKMFDWISYASIIEMLYNADANDDKIVVALDAKPFREFLKKWHSKSYLQIRDKLKQFLSYLKSKHLDVVFLQEAGKVEWGQYLPQQYDFIKIAESVIVFRKAIKDKAVPWQLEKNFMQDYGDRLNFNKDSAFVLFGNLLLISIHLTSKAHRIQQARQMFGILRNIMLEYPTLNMIVGMDANQWINPQDFLSSFPDSNETITTSKKRTMMQMQYHKSDILVQETKDYLMTNMLIKECRVETVLQKEMPETLLPNCNHPFDHFVVSGIVFFDSSEHSSVV